MIFKVELAGQIIKIISKYEKVYSLCRDYLYLGNEKKEVLSININNEDIVKEFFSLNASMPTKQNAHEYISSHYGHLEALAVYNKIANKMPYFDTFLMHGSVVAQGNFAYMFTAPSGIGKTTRTRLWMKEIPNSFVVNGDKPLIKIVDNKTVLACGTPWCGKEGWNTNVMIPLRAIFFLERADENGKSFVSEITSSEAFISLLQQVHHPDDVNSMHNTLHLLKRMTRIVKFYRFQSTPTTEAIRLAYEIANPDF